MYDRTYVRSYTALQLSFDAADIADSLGIDLDAAHQLVTRWRMAGIPINLVDDSGRGAPVFSIQHGMNPALTAPSSPMSATGATSSRRSRTTCPT